MAKKSILQQWQRVVAIRRSDVASLLIVIYIPERAARDRRNKPAAACAMSRTSGRPAAPRWTMDITSLVALGVGCAVVWLARFHRVSASVEGVSAGVR